MSHRRLRHAPDLRARREADGGPDPRHLAGLRQRGRRRRHPVPVHLPHRRHLLVAGRGGGGLRQEAARRQPQGQEDRVSLLRQPGRAASRIEILEDLASTEGFQLKTFAVPPPGRGDGRPGARHRPALPRGLRDRASVRRRPRRVDQGAEAGRLSRCSKVDRVRVGLGRGQHRGRRRLRRWPRATTRCSSPASASDYPVLNEIREMYKKAGQAGAQGDGVHRASTTAACSIAALHVEAIRNALKAKPDGKITGADVKAGFEKINELHPRRTGAAAQDHGDRPRGRRARPDLAGQGRQVREGRPSGSPPIRTWWPSTSRPRPPSKRVARQEGGHRRGLRGPLRCDAPCST